jgi:DNA-binding NarL/FixJ family response regulator
MNTDDQMNIFIVEDDTAYAKILKKFLINRFPNATVTIFDTGEMCLMEIHRNPNIIIMDYFLNSKFAEALNGLEIIKQIQAHNPLTNIIVLSIQDKYSVIVKTIAQYKCFYVQKDQEAFDKVEQIIYDFD